MATPKNIMKTYADLLDKQEEIDVFFKLGSKGREKYGAHQAILSAASTVFKEYVSEKEESGEKLEIMITSVDANLFKKFVK